MLVAVGLEEKAQETTTGPRQDSLPPSTPHETHHGVGPQWSRLSQRVSGWVGSPEEGAEGELCPGAGAAPCPWLRAPLPLGALRERGWG